MFPSILLLHSELAASLLQYRLDRLSEAQQKAVFLGFKGALFPWVFDRLRLFLTLRNLHLQELKYLYLIYSSLK